MFPRKKSPIDRFAHGVGFVASRVLPTSVIRAMIPKLETWAEKHFKYSWRCPKCGYLGAFHDDKDEFTRRQIRHVSEHLRDVLLEGMR